MTFEKNTIAKSAKTKHNEMNGLPAVLENEVLDRLEIIGTRLGCRHPLQVSHHGLVEVFVAFLGEVFRDVFPRLVSF